MSGADVLRRLITLGIKGYKLAISPWFGAACRFTPSCSDYMMQAIEEHGPLRGGWLGARRIARCQPWGGSGYDPVPAGHRHATCAHDTDIHATHRG